MRWFLALTVAGLALSTQAAAAPTTSISFAFGRIGGNIAPFTVTIASNGSTTAAGPARPLKSRVSALELARLSRLVTTQRFFTLPRSTRCPGTLPDFASEFITVHRGALTRRVVVHGDCSPRFTRTYAALTRAVGL
jgi:hypothetical protein